MKPDERAQAKARSFTGEVGRDASCSRGARRAAAVSRALRLRGVDVAACPALPEVSRFDSNPIHRAVTPRTELPVGGRLRVRGGVHVRDHARTVDAWDLAPDISSTGGSARSEG